VLTKRIQTSLGAACGEFRGLRAAFSTLLRLSAELLFTDASLAIATRALLASSGHLAACAVGPGRS